MMNRGDKAVKESHDADGPQGLTPSLSGLAFVRPPLYHSGDDFSQWLVVYESACSANNWPDSMRISYLPMALPRDSPLQLAAAEADKTSSFQSVVEELKSMISIHEPQEKLAKFDARELRVGEKVGEYERALRLLYKASLGPNSDPDSDPRYVKKFISGLPQRWRFTIAAKMYKSVAGPHGALAHAQNLETAEALHGPSFEQDIRHSTIFSQVQASSLTEVDQLRAKIQQLEQDAKDRDTNMQTQISSLTAMMQNLISELREGRGQPRGQCQSTVRRRSRTPSRSFSRGRSNSPSRFFCTFCRRRGHTVDRCFLRQDTRCFKCNMLGHRANDCQRRVDSNRRPNTDTDRTQSNARHYQEN